MTVGQFCYLYIEQNENVSIYSIEQEATVFYGTYNEACFCDYSKEEVETFGIEQGEICINIS